MKSPDSGNGPSEPRWEFLRPLCTTALGGDTCKDSNDQVSQSKRYQQFRIERVPVLKVSSLIYRSSVITAFRDSWVTVLDWHTLRNPVSDATESGVNAFITVNGLGGDFPTIPDMGFKPMDFVGPFGFRALWTLSTTVPPTWFSVITSQTEFVPSFSNSKVEESKLENRWRLLMLSGYTLISTSHHSLPALLEVTGSNTRLCQRSYLYSPRWRVALRHLVSRALIIRIAVHFLSFAPDMGCEKTSNIPQDFWVTRQKTSLSL